MSTTNIKDQLSQEMKLAMRARDKERLGVIRLIQAAFKQKEVDERIEIDDPTALAIMDKMTKQRRESIEQYKKADRNDLVEKENFELKVISEFMPEPLDEAEISAQIVSAIKESGAQSMRDMGKVMEILKPQMQGRADMAKVSSQIKAELNK